MQKNDFYVADAFASTRFTGNPAGVLIFDDYPADSILQNIATEINHAETSFLVKIDENNYKLRWFTPSVEVNLCGHATLAAAHILKQLGHIYEAVHFHTRSGLLSVKVASLSKDSLAGQYVMNFPAPECKPLSVSQDITDNLALQPLFTGMAGEDCMFELSSAMDVVNYQPDFQALSAIESRGVLITSKAEAYNEKYGTAFDIITRCFFPRVGVPEDPVTGSAHCYIAKYWAERLNKNKFKSLQASKRSGIIEIEVVTDRANLTGSAITTMVGEVFF